MERNISRRHARLCRDNGVVFVEDLNSFNGVKINGERIDQRLEIKEGDLVEIGDYHLALQRAEVREEPPADRAPTALAGTVPDFRLPEDILAEAAGLRDSTPTAEGRAPLVSPPPDRKGAPALPPFPASGGPENPFFNPAASSAAIHEGHSARTEQIKVGPARVSDVPRIICVSTEYAGREFALNRPEVIIGRVEDNDIVIEHRSVSRNHAKILFDGRVHKIIDLESANGILVNGEEYAITDLRKGDLIELGHVRFRFVPAGETFAPDEEEARAMLEAGVTPPPVGHSAVAMTIEERPPTEAFSDAPTQATAPDPIAAATVEIPAEVQDASTAATVTDTPLSALNLGGYLEPRVSGDEGFVSSSPTERPARRPSSDETRQTAVGPAPKRRPPSAERFEDSFEAEYQPGKQKLIAAVVVISLLLAVVAFGALKLRGPSAAPDVELKALYDQGQYEKVEEFYLEHAGQFAKKRQALQIVEEARRAKASPKVAPAPPPPERTQVEPELPEGSAPSAAETAEEEDEVEEEVDPSAPAKTKPRRRRRTAPPPANAAQRLAKAQQYELEGRRALFRGELDKAEKMLKLCLKSADYADCHRGLGILYASRDEAERAIEHYEKYIALKPDAGDADKVRSLIREARGH